MAKSKLKFDTKDSEFDKLKRRAKQTEDKVHYNRTKKYAKNGVKKPRTRVRLRDINSPKKQPKKKLTKEERSAIARARAKAYWENMSPEERERRRQQSSARAKTYWANLTPAQRQAQIEKMQAGRRPKAHYSPNTKRPPSKTPHVPDVETPQTQTQAPESAETETPKPEQPIQETEYNEPKTEHPEAPETNVPTEAPDEDTFTPEEIPPTDNEEDTMPYDDMWQTQFQNIYSQVSSSSSFAGDLYKLWIDRIIEKSNGDIKHITEMFEEANKHGLAWDKAFEFQYKDEARDTLKGFQQYLPEELRMTDEEIDAILSADEFMGWTNRRERSFGSVKNLRGTKIE